MKDKVTAALLYSSTTALALGLIFKYFLNISADIPWAIGGFIGLIPSIKWVLDELKDKQMGSDVLAIFSIVGALAIREFFAAAVISFMLASGRALESWAEGRADFALKSLIDRMPKLANRITKTGQLEVIKIEDVEINNRLLVKSGEIVPVDGIAQETCYLDQSALTGEPMPVLLEKAGSVISGTINAGNAFEMIASGNVSQSTYSGIVTMVRNSRAQSSPNIRLANKWALRFVPITMAMAALTFLLTGDATRTVAVLVVATPCPLILAVPIALVSGMSRATKSGAVIKGGAVLEKLSKAEVVLLDKTGTVTHGGPVITEIVTSSGITHEYALQMAASLDQYSPHVVAKSLVDEAKNRGISLLSASNVVEEHGKEVSGEIDGVLIRVGAAPTDLPSWANLKQPLIVALHINNQLIAIFGLEDPIRSESKKTISDLHKLGVIEIVMVTGDKEETASIVASELGINRVIANSSPETKLNVVHEYRNKVSGSVIVVGDGINDAPALAASDVGIAMGARGASAASEAADVVIIEDSIDRVVSAISIAKLSHSKAMQASIGGMGLALIAMFAAAFNLLTPSQGAIAQEFIDLLAIMWALTTLSSK
ncbi:MAG: cadmium-translocating P-type ATPase [Candidatus Nanopelagicaceae bacterium]|nr:cadmium-translocating P-type ATPase [Candidatus Nanopelagicaceae bacterium]